MDERKTSPREGKSEYVSFHQGMEKENRNVLDTEEAFGTVVSTQQPEDAGEARKHITGSVQLFKLDERKEVGLGISLQDEVKSKAQEHYKRGLEQMSMKQMEKAVISFSKAIILGDQMPTELYLKRAEAYLYLCDFQSAALNYRMVCFMNPLRKDFQTNLAFIFYIQGQILYDQEVYMDALESFSQASELNSSNPVYQMRSIACLYALSRHGDCLQLISRQIENEPQNPDLYILRARMQNIFNKATPCYLDVKKALNLDPSNKEALDLLVKLKTVANDAKSQAVCHALRGKLQEALQKINTALENNPAELSYFLFRGSVYRRLKNFNNAIDDCVLVLEQCSHIQESETYTEAQKQLLLTYNDFAVFCYIKGFYEEAVMLLNKAIKKEKEEKGLYVNRGDCFFAQGELEFALADYGQALELDQVDRSIQTRIAAVQNEFGLLDYHSGKYQQAESRFSKAIQDNPTVCHYYLHRATVRQKLQDDVGSKNDALTALILSPKNKQVRPVLSVLFPGMSTSDIMNSEAAERMKSAVAAKLTSPCVQRKHAADPSTETVGSVVQQMNSDTVKSGAEDKGSHFIPCVTEQQLYKAIISRQIKLQEEVRKAFLDRQALKQERININASAKPQKTARFKQAV